jgi:hypothetical protein
MTDMFRTWNNKKEILMTLMNELHVVYGSGPVGTAVVETLLEQGKQVRVVTRSGARKHIPAQAEAMRGDATDLSAVILRTEPGSEMPSTRTNLLVSARIQIPKGSGVFLLKNSSEISDGKTFGVLISVTLLPRRK